MSDNTLSCGTVVKKTVMIDAEGKFADCMVAIQSATNLLDPGSAGISLDGDYMIVKFVSVKRDFDLFVECVQGFGYELVVVDH